MTDAEITRLLANRVMGWEARPLELLFGGSPLLDGPVYWHERREHPEPTGFQSSTVVLMPVDDWDPLTNDAEACAVLDKMVVDGYGCDILQNAGGTVVEFIPGYIGQESGRVDVDGVGGEPRRRAICLAALKAKGVEVDWSKPAQLTV